MIILGIGSNLSSIFGDRFDNINHTIDLLKLEGIKIINKSSFYETHSYPDKTKPKFLNIVISTNSNLSTDKLASIIISIEKKLGRKRKIKNDPRTCDIDIIDFNGKNINFKYKDLQFIVPHEKLVYRNFVLFPLKEILPKWRHPKTNEPVDILIKKLTLEDKNSILKI
jgi:2-amino-4-hydroxy-6-hydroxymethyldihydropteridine diphosphokinase